MKLIPSNRIDNLEFRTASYLLPKKKWPNPIGYCIQHWYPNIYYGRDNEYPEDPNDPNYRLYPNYPNCRIHKSCFKSPLSACVIACFDYNVDEGYYEFSFVGDRPLELTEKERKDFWTLIEYGFKQLNGMKEDG